ncbi:PIN-like domain-containing protein [Lactococcus garvieae]|uniref:PIN-like domain-containing protein n=1 Tax=Lactococcus garvieae TaxID=1363 RepID=UPI00385222BA
MSKLKTEFPEFYQEKLTKDDLQDSLIILDTNYLLDMLRLPVVEAEKYLKALNKFSKKIYIPYLVALEFNFNKIKVKTDTNVLVDNYKENIEQGINDLEEKINDLSLLKSDSMKQQFTDVLIKKVNVFKKELLKDVDSQIDKSFNSKVFYEKVVTAIENKIGERYEQEWITKIEKEGIERYEKGLPPGFDDQSKKDIIRTYNELEYHEKFGDLIIWKDILKKAAESTQASKIIYVTNDGTSSKKNDIMFKHHGKTIGPDIYLIHEAKKETKKNLYILNNFRFAELSATLSDKELNELKLVSKKTDKKSKKNELIKGFFVDDPNEIEGRSKPISYQLTRNAIETLYIEQKNELQREKFKIINDKDLDVETMYKRGMLLADKERKLKALENILNEGDSMKFLDEDN